MSTFIYKIFDKSNQEMRKLIKSTRSDFDKSWGRGWERNAKHGQAS